MEGDASAKAATPKADDDPHQFLRAASHTTDSARDSATPAAPDSAKTSTQLDKNHLQPPVESSSSTENRLNSGSTSVVGSLKEEDALGTGPYGTRSRNRSARPNYADESDADFEKSLRVDSVRQNKTSAPAETAGKRVQSVELNSTGPKGASPSSLPTTNGGDHEMGNSGPATEATASSEVPQERKKRKYVWKNGSKPSPSNRASQNASIPGTSHFMSGADEVSGSAPPVKRRRIVDGSSTAAQHSSGSTSITRKHSTSRHLGRDSCIYSFRKTGAVLKDGKLKADDGTVFAVDDHVYLVCEPPGDPYYLCRIMEFRRDNMDDPQSPVTSMIVNWFYRPKDIGKTSSDSRFLYASMQSDESPINSLRGKCQISHRSQIKSLDEYRKDRDTFWFAQLYDRYIHRPYDLIPAASVINVPEAVKKAINDRWKFLAVESARMKELTSAVKLCKRCNGYCAPNDSVDCGVCRNTYHMTCVRPPLAKKPSRGFAWSCGPCSRAQEKKLEQRHTAVLRGPDEDHEDEILEDEEEEHGAIHPEPSTVAPSVSSGEASEQAPETQAEVAKAQQWPWRYLGIHCKVEDVLQYDDRAIYPRASSRLGPRHQAATMTWPGRPLELVKPADIKRRYVKGAPNKKDPKLSKDTLAALEADKAERAKRPKWVQDEPPGYFARGEDLDNDDPNCTAKRLFVMPNEADTPSATDGETLSANESAVEDYMVKARQLASDSGLTRSVYPKAGVGAPSTSRDIVPTNYLDKALNVLYTNNFDATASLKEMELNFQNPKEFGNPVFTKEETKRFEDGVARYGSELRLVRRHVKHRPYGDIVRFYYAWKKSERGQEIWGRHDARRGTRKRAATSWTEIADDEDDSAFDNEKSVAKKRKFQCKFCHVKSSPLWRRAPDIAPGAVVLADPKGSAKDKANQLVLALCQRCAIPWRRYSMKWEDPEELAKILHANGGRTWKRRSDEEMLREMVIANEIANVPTGPFAAAAAATIGITVTVSQSDRRRKGQENEESPVPSTEKEPKKKGPAQPPPRPPTPPIVPQQPQLRDFPCAVCSKDESLGPLVTCTHCRLAVHRSCFAVPDHVSAGSWVCDTCVNDKSGLISFNYNCVLCTVGDRQPEMVEQPKPANQKKKTERDKEKERLEKELADVFAANYKKEQIAKGCPPHPREAVKRTASNNWMHVTCAIWTPEIKFGDAARMEFSEGMAAIIQSQARMDVVCKICRVVKGACISCHQCPATFHVACAHEAGFVFGFDVTPVKGSRKDSISTVAVGGETGLMTAAVWCKEHEPITKNIVHGVHEVVQHTGLTALQTFVQTYKQADLALTGTARKANMLSQTTKLVTQGSASTNAGRRASLLTNGAAVSKRARSPPSPTQEDVKELANGIHAPVEEAERRHCVTCGSQCSFRWWIFHQLTNGTTTSVPEETKWECHKCHMLVAPGSKAPAQPIEEEIGSPSPHQPDFFELTMPPPPPPPAPVAPPAIQGPPLPNTFAGPPPPHGAAPPPHPHQNVVPVMQHSPTPVLQNGPNDDEDKRNIEKWTHDLWASTVVLTNASGQVYRFSGREFGTLNDHPMVAWNHLVTRSREAFNFNPNDQVIVTEDGIRITDSNFLMQALAKMLRGGVGEARWFVENVIPPSRAQFWPTPGGHAYHQQQAPLYHQPITSTPRALSAKPHPPTVPPALQPAVPLPPVSYPTQMSPHISPFYSHSKSPSQGSNVGPGVPSSLSTGNTSPNTGNIRPRTPAGTGTAASSSPNVRNLVH